MADASPIIQFEPKGIGAALAHNLFTVPLNQREYSWEEEQVTELFQDLARVIDNDNPTYFLGTIVLTGGKQLEVADGQQRLATVTILLAAIRDYMHGIGDQEFVEAVEPVYLRERDLETGQLGPKLRLNVDDNLFFIHYVLSAPGSPERSITPQRDSHKRIRSAAALARQHVDGLVAALRPEDRKKRLVKWVKFLKDGVLVILARVPDHLNAFVMFETLNDRGLRASQADLLKNYLLQRAGGRVGEAQQRWAKMLGVLESLGVDDITVTYLRHAVILTQGPTKERDLYGKVVSLVTSEERAIQFVDSLADNATTYAAILNPNHSFWIDYPPGCSLAINTLLELQIKQIRPLVFAVLQKFPAKEVEKALLLCVSWSVRFLIVGGRGGLLDQNYAEAAKGVGTGQIVNARSLASSLKHIIPTDAEFQAEFAEARVTKSYLAKYYLRALELESQGTPEPELIPNNDVVLNLEHVLPENPGSNWPGVDSEIAEGFRRRLGNMVLLPHKKNSKIGNKSFTEKRKVLRASSLQLTSDVGKEKSWGVKEIMARQQKLAVLAVKTWPLTAS